MFLCLSNMIELSIYSFLSIQIPHQTTVHVDCIILVTRLERFDSAPYLSATIVLHSSSFKSPVLSSQSTNEFGQ